MHEISVCKGKFILFGLVNEMKREVETMCKADLG